MLEKILRFSIRILAEIFFKYYNLRSDEYERTSNQKWKCNGTKPNQNHCQVAMLGAVAGVLMNFEVPLPFLAHPFTSWIFRNSGTDRFLCNGTCGGHADRAGEDSGSSGNKGTMTARCWRCGELHLWLLLCNSGRPDLPLPA